MELWERSSILNQHLFCYVNAVSNFFRFSAHVCPSLAMHGMALCPWYNAIVHVHVSVYSLINTWLKMSSLIASQSTFCLQTRQDAVANEPDKKKDVSDLSP